MQASAKYFRRLRVIDTLFALVHCHSIILNGGTASRSVDPALLSLRLAYHLVFHAVKGCRQNELYASAWIHTITNHSGTLSETVDLNASVLLTSLLASNERLLDEAITPSIVHQFLHLVVTQVNVAPHYIMSLLSLS